MLAYIGQQHTAAGAFQNAVDQAPAQDGASSPDLVPPLPGDPPATLPAGTEPVTQVLPLADSPQASVPANAAGR
jgi:hypothetical protein